MSETTIKQPMVVTTAPERIYLQIADDCYYEDQPFPGEHSDQVTWCANSVESCEVPYIRADLAETKAQTVDVATIRDVIAQLNAVGTNCEIPIEPRPEQKQPFKAMAEKLAAALPKGQTVGVEAITAVAASQAPTVNDDARTLMRFIFSHFSDVSMAHHLSDDVVAAVRRIETVEEKAQTVNVEAIREVIKTLSYIDKPYQNAMREKLSAALLTRPHDGGSSEA